MAVTYRVVNDFLYAHEQAPNDENGREDDQGDGLGPLPAAGPGTMPTNPGDHSGNQAGHVGGTRFTQRSET